MFLDKFTISKFNVNHYCVHVLSRLEGNGKWSYWNVWSSCSVTCGKGTRGRTRYCMSTTSKSTSDDCLGESKHNVPCSKNPCPGTKRSVKVH